MKTTYETAREWYFGKLGFDERYELIEKHIPTALLPLSKNNIIKLYKLTH